MDSKSSDSVDSGSLSSGVNEDFERFLDELSTSSNASENVGKTSAKQEKELKTVGGKTQIKQKEEVESVVGKTQTKLEKEVEAVGGIAAARHTWLKNTSGQATIEQQMMYKLPVEQGKVKVIKLKESPEDTSTSEKDDARKHLSTSDDFLPDEGKVKVIKLKDSSLEESAPESEKSVSEQVQDVNPSDSSANEESLNQQISDDSSLQIEDNLSEEIGGRMEEVEEEQEEEVEEEEENEDEKVKDENYSTSFENSVSHHSSESDKSDQSNYIEAAGSPVALSHLEYNTLHKGLVSEEQAGSDIQTVQSVLSQDDVHMKTKEETESFVTKLLAEPISEAELFLDTEKQINQENITMESNSEQDISAARDLPTQLKFDLMPAVSLELRQSELGSLSNPPSPIKMEDDDVEGNVFQILKENAFDGAQLSDYTTELQEGKVIQMKNQTFKAKDNETPSAKARTSVWARLYPNPTSDRKQTLINTSELSTKPKMVTKRTGVPSRSVVSNFKSAPSLTNKRATKVRNPLVQKAKCVKGPAAIGPEVSLMKQELADQENLINGFQTENARLYAELREKNAEVLKMKEISAREKEQLQWQIGNLREKIRFLEFDHQIRKNNHHPDQCEHLESLKNVQSEKDALKVEIDSMRVQLSSLKSLENSKRAPTTVCTYQAMEQDNMMLKEQLAKTEQVAANLQLRLTDILHSEKSLKTQIDSLNQKQKSCHAVTFFEDQLKNVFELQRRRDDTVKDFLEDIHKEQNIMKLAYQEAIKEAEDNYQDRNFSLEMKLKEAENTRSILRWTDVPKILSSKVEVHSTHTQCDLLHVIEKTRNLVKNEETSVSIQCNLNDLNQRRVQNKYVQCYLNSDANSNIVLENKELKFRVERLILENKEYKMKLENILEKLVLLEQTQSRLEHVQEQWEQQVNENASLKNKLYQVETKLATTEDVLKNSQLGIKVFSLEKKISELQKSHIMREEQLLELQKQVGKKSQDMSWQEQVSYKNSIINQYREELDKIIHFLYQLQGQQHNTVPTKW